MNHLFRHESGKMVSVLVKIFGSEHFELAEDVVQEALLSALKNWSINGIPDNPKAWLYRTSKNKAIDIIRKKKHLEYFDFSDPDQQLLKSEYTLASTMETFWEESHVQDDFLGMMYASCHPSLSQENQVTFILKSLCGFSTSEVAKAFVCGEDTISKRLYRTKEFLRKEKFRPKLPEPQFILERTPAVLSSIYLMFNEGYHSTHANELIRDDLISQSFWLCKSLLNNTQTNLPEVNALMALMCLHTARIESRLDSEGNLILLPDQDRSLWNQELIHLGGEYLNKSAFGERLTSYHLEAAISYEHCAAATFQVTNWQRILKHYNALLQIKADPIVQLNRSIAVWKCEGANSALKLLNGLSKEKSLQKYALFYAIRAEILNALFQKEKAVVDLNLAIQFSKSEKEKLFLRSKIMKFTDLN